MNFVSFNYWHPRDLVWVPVVYNTDRIDRMQQDTDNPTMTRVWLQGQYYPELLTDLTWAEATTLFGGTAPKAIPTSPPHA
jgi:hypothetical protein